MKVIVLLPDVAAVVVESQSPPYEKVPASDVVTTTSGVVLFVGVVTAVVSVMVGVVVSIPDIAVDAVYDVLPAESVEEKQIFWPLSDSRLSVMLSPSVYEVVSDDKAALSQVVEEGISFCNHVVAPESSSTAETTFDVAAFVLGLVTVMLGPVASTVNDVSASAVEALPAVSVSVIVQSE